MFFLTLVFFALFLFTKTDDRQLPTRRKRQRNSVYKVCSCTIAVCLFLIYAHNLLPASITLGLDKYRPIFALETLAVIAFGASWLVKGEAILRD